MAPRSEELVQLADFHWANAKRKHDSRDLDRLEEFFKVVRGDAKPPPCEANRELHSCLFLPGLRGKPWWEPETYPLCRMLKARFDLIRAEAISVLTRPGAFSQHPGRHGYYPVNAPGSPVFGIWFGYYLQRHLRPCPESALLAPVALRALETYGNSYGPSREALLSFLGPNSMIKRHSDKVNFVLTVYLPLFAEGAWIDFGGERRRWLDGESTVADSSYFHESVNPGDSWRGLLIIDQWHPDLTDVEKQVLGVAVPPINDVLRSLE
jgi:hypothetical protein